MVLIRALHQTSRAVGIAIAALLALGVTASASSAPRPVRVYLAGPLGFSEAGTQFKDAVLIKTLTKLGYEVIDPWKLTAKDKIDKVLHLPYGAERRDAWKALDAEIARNNEAGIDRADAVIAVLDGTDVDSGTAAEIGYAYGRGKPVLGYRGDFRESADNEGAIVNLQVEYFIRQRGGEIISSVRDLPRALESFGTIARLEAGIPASVPPAANPVSGTTTVAPSATEAVKDVVRFVEGAFTIVLALAFGESFKQFVAESPLPPPGGSPSGLGPPAIHWDRIGPLLILLLFLLPFFQGMNRYFFVTYGDASALPRPYAVSLIVDGLFFSLEAALFFVMSRSLSPQRWRRFFASVLALLTADSLWAWIAIAWHNSPVEPWLILNVISGIATLVLLGLCRSEKELRPFVTAIAVVAALVRTVVDYNAMWSFYFPQ